MLFPFSGQRKFKKKIQYVKEMHGSLEAVDTEDEAAHAIVPPCLIIAPEVFWPQDLNAKHTESPTNTMILRWRDPVDEKRLIVGYRLVVYKGVRVSGESNLSAGSKTKDREDKEEEKEDVSIEIIDETQTKEQGGQGFVYDKYSSRAQIFFDDENLVHEHDSDKNNHSAEMIGSGKLDGGGGLLDVASGDVYNFLKVQHLEPNRDYKFSVSTFSSLKLQQMKQKHGPTTKTNKQTKKAKKKLVAFRLADSYEISRPSPMTISKCKCLLNY
jgi:hypothetical protein